VSSKAPGSIGKLKISSEMRAKLELVTIGHGPRSPAATQADAPTGRGASPDRDADATVGVRKLEDNRKLMLMQQLSTTISTSFPVLISYFQYDRFQFVHPDLTQFQFSRFHSFSIMFLIFLHPFQPNYLYSIWILFLCSIFYCSVLPLP